MAMVPMVMVPSVRRHVIGTAAPYVSQRLAVTPTTTAESFRLRVSRCAPAAPGTSATAAAPDDAAGGGAPPPPPPASFPWRHAAAPPPRIGELDDFSGMPNNARARFVRRAVACRELGVSAWEGVYLPFFTHRWEEDLAGNFLTAFELALEELLAGWGAVTVRNEAVWGTSIAVDSSVETDTDTTNDWDHDTYLNSMFDDKLVREFQTVNFDRLRLRLSVRPVRATLQHIFAIPLLTRDIVKKKPHLAGGYQAIEKAFVERASYDEVRAMTYELANEIGEDDAYRRTVVADVLITCAEVYQLRDSAGTLLRGMEDGVEEEEVVHTVRFEVTTDKDTAGKGRRVGSWKIVDLDDLLEGNVFY